MPIEQYKLYAEKVNMTGAILSESGSDGSETNQVDEVGGINKRCLLTSSFDAKEKK